jgi:hypothetical protein
LLHLTRDGGATWSNVTPPADLLPEWALISIIEVSPHDPATTYVAATRYKLDDTAPYLLKTNDYGKTWTRITGGIPSHEFTRVIREDPGRRGLLYAGTETGLYVSFDDGQHWGPLGGNFPVVPVHDLLIKGVEMVVASHGRSFWILDDLTPLHQLSDEVLGRATYLFKPRPTIRLHTPGERFAAHDRPDMVNYDRVDALLVSYQAKGSNRRYLDAGESPTPGVHVAYYVLDAPSGPVTLDILSGDGQTVLRTFAGSDVQSGAGINRFVWNMRVAGAPRLADESLDPWQRDDGPMVSSGEYQVRLSVDGQTLIQTFEIVPNPLTETSEEGLREQFDMLGAILEKISTINQLVNRVGRLQAQVSAWDQWTADLEVAAVRDGLAALKADLDSVKRRLVDVHYPEAQLYANALQEKFNALYEFVDSADYAPPQQGREVLEDLSARLDAVVEDFESQVLPRVGVLNDAIRGADIPAIVDTP